MGLPCLLLSSGLSKILGAGSWLKGASTGGPDNLESIGNPRGFFNLHSRLALIGSARILEVMPKAFPLQKEF